MNFRMLAVVFTATFLAVDGISIDHDKVRPLAQPEPVTIAEKAGVKFKPRMSIREACASYPAVNEAGETSGGLKGSGGSSGCEGSPFGSQVYGRAAWHNDLYAIVYAWYFPKGFSGPSPSRRHDWASAVVWLDNPDVATPKIMGLSLSKSDDEYKKNPIATVPSHAISAGTTLKLFHDLSLFGTAVFDYPAMLGSRRRGIIEEGATDTENASTDFQDLIMWDQLPEAARTVLNTADFGDAKVPVADANFHEKLEQAWPF